MVYAARFQSLGMFGVFALVVCCSNPYLAPVCWLHHPGHHYGGDLDHATGHGRYAGLKRRKRTSPGTLPSSG